MRAKDYIRLYVQSPIGIAGFFASGGVALAGVAAGLTLPLALIAGACVLVSAGAVTMFTKWGSRQLVYVRDHLSSKAVGERLARAESLQKRLASMRIGDPEVAESVLLVALASGEYLSACKREKTYDPLANEALEASVEIIRLFLAESDEASMEKRFNLDDANPFGDAKARTIALLKEHAGTLRERKIQVDGGLPARDRMAIREELK